MNNILIIFYNSRVIKNKLINDSKILFESKLIEFKHNQLVYYYKLVYLSNNEQIIITFSSDNPEFKKTY